MIAISGAFAGAVCFIAIGWGLLQSAEYQRQADYRSSQYAKYTHEYVGYRCVSGTPLDKADCVAEATDKRRAYDRDEQDLVAQRQSALWAYIMGAAAVVGVGLSAVGVWLVYTTFNATREGNTIARNTATLAQQEADLQKTGLRAWIHAEPFKDVIMMNGKPMLQLGVIWVNGGQTPAVKVVSFQKYDNAAAQPVYDSGSAYIIGPGQRFSGVFWMYSLQELATKSLQEEFVSECVYNDIFSKERRKTVYRFGVTAGPAGMMREGFKGDREFIERILINYTFGVTEHVAT